MTKDDVRAICNVFGIDPRQDWHAMTSGMKDAVIRAADSRGYVKPKNANGSRGRYFAAYLSRVWNKETK
jgi:hypothetical protein